MDKEKSYPSTESEYSLFLSMIKNTIAWLWSFKDARDRNEIVSEHFFHANIVSQRIACCWQILVN